MRTYPHKLDESPKTESVRKGKERRYRYRYRKYSMFNWRKLKNFIKAQVGRTWDEVWSEISENNDWRVASEDAFRESFKEKIRFDVYVDENGDFQSVDWRGMVWSQWSDTFYVEKDTGILKYIPKTKKRRYIPRESNIVHLNGLEYFKHEGLWYEVVTVSFKEFENYWYYHWKTGDAFNIPSYEAYRYYNEAVRVIRKKQVGKKMIRKINDYLESLHYDA